MSKTTKDTPSVSPKSVFRVFIRAPIETVWAELTRTKAPLPFFFGASCDTPGLAPGATFRMQSRSDRYTVVVGEVLEFDPPHLYSHTMKFTTMDDAPCRVTYHLKELEGGVEFTLTTEQVPTGSKTEKSMVSGSQFIVDNLKAVVETGKPTFTGRMILTMIALTEVFTPRRARSEHWPLGR